MNGWRGMFAGMLALIALEAVVSTADASGRIGGAMAAIATGVDRLFDPGVALIPDLRHKSASSTTAATPAASTTARPGVAATGSGTWLDYQPHKPATPAPLTVNA